MGLASRLLLVQLCSVPILFPSPLCAQIAPSPSVSNYLPICLAYPLIAAAIFIISLPNSPPYSPPLCMDMQFHYLFTSSFGPRQSTGPHIHDRSPGPVPFCLEAGPALQSTLPHNSLAYRIGNQYSFPLLARRSSVVL